MVLPFFVLFLIILTVSIRSNRRKEKETLDRFWERENLANNTRRKDLTHLSYITIPDKLLADIPVEDDGIAQNILSLKELSAKKIVNLNEYSNTDLKLKYGAANLPALMEYDENYNILILTLVEISHALIDHGLPEDAIRYLSFGADCSSDITENYTLLAQLYRDGHQDAALAQLYTQIRQLTCSNKEHILKAVLAI
ncbi:MAG: hypothetical protein IJ567_11380 [Lachnospiraceae bacterium]|nr:hypothetical protein [Lachnospiraceae bacterium]